MTDLAPLCPKCGYSLLCDHCGIHLVNGTTECVTEEGAA